MARIPNINDLTFAQLAELQQRVEAAMAERKAAEAREVKEQMAALAAKSGFTVGELFGRGGKRVSGAIKFKNPKNPAETWTGRGRKPNWLVAELKKGAKLESFAV